MQSARLPLRQDIVPDASRTIGTVAQHKALADQAAKLLIAPAALAARAREPRVKATSSDTERLAHQIHRPDSSVFRHEAESHIDSFAK